VHWVKSTRNKGDILVEEKYISADLLVNMATKMFIAEGLRNEDAQTIAMDLVAADLRGLASHGVSRIPMYLSRIRLGLVTPRPDIKVTKVAPAAILIDGDNGMGFLASHKAVKVGVGLAEETGIAIVGVRRSTHFGMSACYVQQAIDSGYVSLVFTNSSPALPPIGARVAFLGAAPFAAGIPGGNESPPYLLDMAMTVIARGKIRVAAKNNEPIPLGLALDSEGKPTTDAAKAFAGVCLPFGGAKGAGLAMLMDLICGLFTGANYGGDVKSLYFDQSEPQNVGHTFILIKPNLFISNEELRARMDEFYHRLINLPKADGVERIFMPGQRESELAVQRRVTGVPISKNILADLKEVADKYNLSMPEIFG